MKMTAEEKEKAIALYSALRASLKSEGWTQRRLCAALGRSEAWLSKIIHAGRGMDVNDLLRISALTGISIEKLLVGFSPEKAPSEAEEVAKQLNEFLPDDVWERLVKLRESKKNK